MRHFNAADKLQHVNAVRVNGGLSQQWDDRRNIHKIFTESILQDGDSRVGGGAGLLPPVSGGICWNANGRVQLEGTDVTFQI